MQSSAQPILIDTDIGDDVDDAFALALATTLSQLHLCGVTTVSGPVEQRARLARQILRAAGLSHIPVIPGSSTMQSGQPGPAKFSHRSVLEAKEEATSHTLQTATELILACSHQHTPLTIIALGPLTNIAAALEQDLTLAKRARLVAMAGTLGMPYPDWNLRCDPLAARKVFASGMPITLVGMHLTMQTKMHLVQVEHLFHDSRPLIQTLAGCVLACRTWHRRIPILHDALTVAVAAEPTMVRQELRHMRVYRSGFSRASRSARPNVQVCTALDLERFHTLLNTYLFRAPLLTSTPCNLWCHIIGHLA